MQFSIRLSKTQEARVFKFDRTPKPNEIFAWFFLLMTIKTYVLVSMNFHRDIKVV